MLRPIRLFASSATARDQKPISAEWELWRGTDHLRHVMTSSTATQHGIRLHRPRSTRHHLPICMPTDIQYMLGNAGIDVEPPPHPHLPRPNPVLWLHQVSGVRSSSDELRVLELSGVLAAHEWSELQSETRYRSTYGVLPNVLNTFNQLRLTRS